MVQLVLRLLFVSVHLQPPARNRRQGSTAQKAAGILKVFVASQNLTPARAVTFQHGGACEEQRRIVILGFYWHRIYDEGLFASIFCQVAESHNLRASPQ